MIKIFKGWVLRYRLTLSILFLVLSVSSLVCSLIYEEPPHKSKAKKYLFVFDISRSMTVEDCLFHKEKLSRLDAAKQAARETIAVLPAESMISVGAFVGKASSPSDKNFMLFLPYCRKQTSLYDIYSSLNIVEWRNAWAAGSDIYGMLQELAEEKFEDDTHAIIFTDGGTVGIPYRWIGDVIEKMRSNKRLRLTFVGVGETSPSFVPDFDEWGKKLKDHLKDDRGQYFTSRLDELSLKQVATETGGHYERLMPGLNWKITQSAREEATEQNVITDQIIFLLAALTFFVVYLVI